MPTGGTLRRHTRTQTPPSPQRRWLRQLDVRDPPPFPPIHPHTERTSCSCAPLDCTSVTLTLGPLPSACAFCASSISELSVPACIVGWSGRMPGQQSVHAGGPLTRPASSQTTSCQAFQSDYLPLRPASCPTPLQLTLRMWDRWPLGLVTDSMACSSAPAGRLGGRSRSVITSECQECMPGA